MSEDSIVSVERLIDVTWAEEPPATARQQVQNCIGLINSMLTRSGHTETARRSGSGYVLELDGDVVDERLFRSLHAEATTLRQAGRHAEAASRLRAGLALWHGSALEDVGSDALTGAATRLEELRVRTLEQLVECEFAQGRHPELIPDLQMWTAAHRYNESLHASLAVALHRVCRAGDGLEVLRRYRCRLNDELGVEPGAAIQAVEQHLLGRAGDSSGEALGGGPELTLTAVHSAIVRLTEAVQTLIDHVGSPRTTWDTIAEPGVRRSTPTPDRRRAVVLHQRVSRSA